MTFAGLENLSVGKTEFIISVLSQHTHALLTYLSPRKIYNDNDNVSKDYSISMLSGFKKIVECPIKLR